VAQSILVGGENRARSLETIASIVSDSLARADEAKGYRQVLKALAADPANGIDPASIDKMSLGQAKGSIMAAEVRRAGQQRQQQQAGQAAIGKFLQTWKTAQQPQTNLPPGAPAAAAASGQPLAAGLAEQATVTPGQNPADAFIAALNQNPDLFKSPEALSTATSLARMTAGMGAGGQRINPVTGVPEYQEQNGSWRPFNPAWLRGGAGGTALERLTGDRPPTGAPVPEDREWSYGPQGWVMVPKAKPAKPAAANDFMSMFQKVLTGDQTPTAEPGEVNGPPIGAVVKGYKFLGGNPADEKNWERADE